MRIVQVVHGFPPDAWAGTELVAFYLAQALKAQGHHVTVLTRTEDAGAEEGSVREEHLHGCDVLRVVNNYTKTTSFRLFYDNAFYDDLVLRTLEQVRPDIVHFQHLAHFSVSLLPLAASQGYPTVLSLHDFFFPCHRVHLIDAEERLCSGPERGERCVSCLQGFAPPDELRRRFSYMEEALQAPDAVLVASSFLYEKIVGYFPLLRERLRLAPLGVQPIPLGVQKPRCGGRLRLLYAGLLFPPKGAHVLIEALRGLPADTVELSIHGAVLPFWQPYVDRLQEEARDLPIRFCGAYAHDQLGVILSEHDVLVMPMICEETFSLLTREALMAGLPVVAARRGALPEIIQDGVNGLLFEPENAVDLRCCLRRLAEEPSLLERLRPVVVRLKTMDEYARELEQIYVDVTARPSHERRQRVEQARIQSQRVMRDVGEQAAARDSKPEMAGEHHDSRSANALVAVSVLLPTKNGEKYLAEVIGSIQRQTGNFSLVEILAVDSGSRDQTVPILQRLGVTVIQIPAHEFGHGKTRNLLASRATGDMLAFLSQDATPADDRWLEYLIAPLRDDPLIAGAYGRHRPRPQCHPMEWHRILEYELHGRPESRVHSAVNNPDYERNPALYRFFANTSSVIRRSVWEKFPFPEVDFAEDHAWAARVLAGGYKTAYAADSVVLHSHSYGPWVNFCRHFEHVWAMRQMFAQPRCFALRDCFPAALQVARSDLAFWRRAHGQSKFQAAVQWAVPALCWHLAANLGVWLGERAERLPERLVRLLSLQERLKRK